MITKDKFIFIAGGSFQGKSLIAMHIANKYKYSGVVCTDMIRNLLRNHATIVDKEQFFSTSTYKMPPECLIKQKELVSEEVIKLLPIYQSRGEKIIFEGMHFSDTFINDYLSQKSYLKIFIDNQIDLRHKVEWKQETRSLLSVKNEMDKFDYNSTLYHDHEDRIIEIHTQMKEICSRSNFHIVSFTDIVDGKAQCDSIVEDYLKNV